MSAVPPVRPVEWTGDRLRILDQTVLPEEERYLEAATAKDVIRAIRSLAVRGAPLLGIAAAYGVVLAAMDPAGHDGVDALRAELRRAGRALVASRPTAVNIAWAVDRVLASAEDGSDVPGIRAAVLREAGRIVAEDEASCLAIGRFGAELLPDGANVLTHCNTGALATGGIGTALGIIHVAHEAGKGPHVWAGETRPLWQGARLTAWELNRLGIPVTVIVDSAAAALMASGAIDVVVVGADRIAANGDVANKVGTYALALAAHEHGIPFYVAAPVSTVDLQTASGAEIVVERRNPDEVTAPFGRRIVPEGTWAVNPAFDVTPARFVTGIVTDRGVVGPPYRTTLRRAVGSASGPDPLAASLAEGVR